MDLTQHSAFMLLSPHFCQTFNTTLWRFKPASQWCHPCNIIPSYQAFLLPPSFCLILHALAPTSVYSSSPATTRSARSHPPPLCPLTTWHLFRFIPISWQTACISTAGHNAAILVNQWRINQCYLFFPCLCCHWFFFCYFAVCGVLNFAQLNWVDFQEQIVAAQGIQLWDGH